MGAGLSVIDKTVQESNIWLKDVERRLGASRHEAYASLRVTLHALRDRLPPETALHFADQLPILLRGVFAEGWSLVGKPTEERTAEAFADKIAQRLPPGLAMDGKPVARAVFQVIRDRMDVGEVDKVLGHLPGPIRELWAEETHA